MAQAQRNAGCVAFPCKVLVMDEREQADLADCIYENLLPAYGQQWMKSTTDDRRKLARARTALSQAMLSKSTSLEEVQKCLHYYHVLLSRFVKRLDLEQAESLLYAFRWKCLISGATQELRDVRLELLLLNYNRACLQTQLACRDIRAAVSGGRDSLSSEELQIIGERYRRAEVILDNDVVKCWKGLSSLTSSRFQAVSRSLSDISLERAAALVKLCHGLSCFWWSSSVSTALHREAAVHHSHASRCLASLLDEHGPQLVLIREEERAVIHALAAHAQLCHLLHALSWLQDSVPDSSSSLQAGYAGRAKQLYSEMKGQARPLALHVPFFLSYGYVLQTLSQLQQSGTPPSGFEDVSHTSLLSTPVQRQELRLEDDERESSVQRQNKSFLWMERAADRGRQQEIYSAWYTSKIVGVDREVSKGRNALCLALHHSHYPWILKGSKWETASQLSTGEKGEQLLSHIIPGTLKQITHTIQSHGREIEALKIALEQKSQRGNNRMASILEAFTASGKQAKALAIRVETDMKALQQEWRELPPLSTSSSFTFGSGSGSLEQYVSSLLQAEQLLQKLQQLADSMDITAEHTPSSASWIKSQEQEALTLSSTLQTACTSILHNFQSLSQSTSHELLLQHASLHSQAHQLYQKAVQAQQYYTEWSRFVVDVSRYNPYYQPLQRHTGM